MFAKVEHTDDWLINRFSQVINDVSQAPADMQQKVAIIVKLFDAGVDFLRDPQIVPNLAVNQLMTLTWRLVGNRITPAAVVEKMPLGHPETLHFWCEIKANGRLGVIMVPFEWDKMCQEDRYMQLGGLVFVGSQCADYFHEKVSEATGDRPAMARARAYEAEYLRTIQGFSGVRFNDYQKRVLEAFPQGLDSLPQHLRYELKPYMPEDFAMLRHFGTRVYGPNGPQPT